MINKIKNRWEVLVILFLGLTPLLWFKKPSSLALGHDMGFPVDPISFFTDRLFLWTDRVGLGWDQTLGSAALLIHGLEALLSALGLSVFSVQKIVFIFWFVLPGLTMYYFVSRIHRDKNEWFLRLSASLFYMFNHFILQGWFIAERTKFSLYAALPLHLSFLMRMIQGKISITKGVALMSLVFFFLNGGGGIPLYGGLLLTLSIAFVFFGYLQIRKNTKIELKRLFFIILAIPISFSLANFYWILPTFIKTFASYSESLSSIGGISSVLDWSYEVSRFASLQNVIRLQGIPDWYDNPLHPYSKVFFENPLLVLYSFLIPVTVFSSLVLVKKLPEYRRNIIFFNILAVLGIIFTAGSHPPFGFIYDLLLTYIPGFAIFRSGFYKFAPALWFSYAYLFSFSLYIIIQKTGFIKGYKFKNLIFVTVLTSILVYNFPFFTGTFFNWRSPFSTMTQTSNYVIDFGKWSNLNLSFNDRVLSFPMQNRGWNVSTYDWGYWSTAPIEGTLTNNSIITNDRVMSPFEKKLVEKIYLSILEENSGWEKPLKILGINYFLLHSDFFFNAPKMNTVDPKVFEDKFSKLGLAQINSFGQWSVFKLNSSGDRIFVDASPDLITGENEILNDQFTDVDSILGIPELSNFYLTNDPNYESKDKFTREIQINKCLFCDKENERFSLYPPEPRILPDSPLYFLSERKEEKQRIISSANINSEIDFSLGTSLKRIGEIKSMVSRKKSENDIASSIKKLELEIDRISKALEKIDKNSNSSQLLVLRVNNFLGEEQRLIDEISEQGNKNVNSMMIPVSSKISNTYQEYEKYQYEYPLENEKIFFFNSANNNVWELMLKNQEANEEIKVEKIFVDKKELSFVAQGKNGYTSFGNLNLNPGEHEIKFIVNNTLNLINLEKNYSSDGCHDFAIDKVYPDKIYKLSFDFKGKNLTTERRAFIKIEQKTDEGAFSSRMKFSENASSNRFESKITTSNQSNGMKISICPPSGKASDIKIENVEFKLFTVPTAILLSNNEPRSSKPEISVRQKNQTKYEVNVKNSKESFLLVMNNEHNSNWEISGEHLKSEHIRVNGFANGWLIDKPGDYVLEVSYRPQKYFYIGVIVTGGYMILVIVYLLKKRNEDN